MYTTTITTLGNPDKPQSVETKYTTDTYVSIYKDEYEYYDNGNVKTQIHSLVKDDIQIEKTTTNNDENGAFVSKTSEMTLMANEPAFIGGLGLVARNLTEENVVYSYSIDAEGNATINADNIEISPARYYFGYNPRPVIGYDISTGAEVEITSEENLSIINKEYRNYEETRLNNLTINGNKNTIIGSYKDDNITVRGNHNKIDLAEGNDKLNVIGFNNTIKNVEEIVSNPNE